MARAARRRAVARGALALALIAPFAAAQSAQSGQQAQPAVAPYEPVVQPASDEAQQALAGITVAPGLAVELYAAEPMLANPVCLALDRRGDVYVGETFRVHAGVTDIRSHMDWLNDDLQCRTVADRIAMMLAKTGEHAIDYVKDRDRIRLLRDDDGDGRPDRALVFDDDFHAIESGIGAGLLVHGGDVYYTCIPDLWRLADRDDDGRADLRELLSTGYGVKVAFLGHDLHGLALGPDGRLYFSIGDRGLHVQTPDGVLDSPDTGAVLRCNLDGSGLTLIHTGLRNPQELAFDDLGHLFTGDNNADGGDRARLVAIVPGGDSGWRQPYQWLDDRGPWGDEQLWKPAFAGQSAAILPPIANVASGPSGLCHYPGTGLPPAFADHLFLCDFTGDAVQSRIRSFAVSERGASFEMGPDEPLLEGALVTDCDVGPDGALYATDWVAGWNGTGKGRIWRVFDPAQRGGENLLAVRRLLADGPADCSVAQLVELLGHADQRVRLDAQFELVGRGAVGRFALEQRARSPGALLPRLHAAWGLGMLARRDPDALTSLAGLEGDEEPELRAASLAILGEAGCATAGARALAEAAVLPRLADDDARVAAAAALAAGQLGLPGAVDALLALLVRAGEGDPYLRHAAIMGLVGCADGARLAALAHDGATAVRLGAVVALRRRADPALAQFLHDADPLVVLEAARAIHDVPVPAALPALADLITSASFAAAPLPEGGSFPGALVRRVLNANLRLGGEDRARALSSFALRTDVSDEDRLAALQMLERFGAPSPRDLVTGFWWPIEPRETPWLKGLARELDAGGILQAPEPLALAAVSLAATSGCADLAPTLRTWVQSPDESSARRVAALAALETLAALDLKDLVASSLGDPDGPLRAAALAALERLAPGDALPRVPDLLDHGECAEQRVAFGILGRAPGQQADDLLVAQLEQMAAGTLPVELSLDVVLAAEQRHDPRVAELLDRHRRAQSAEPELAGRLDALFGGDRERGQAVFERAALSCTRCHATDAGDPPRVGPNLHGAGGRLARLQVLQAIVTPNRRTAPGYASTLLVLRDGDVRAGRVLDEHDGGLRLQESSSQIREIRTEDIAERRQGLSAMPEELGAAIAPADLRDLIEYVATL